MSDQQFQAEVMDELKQNENLSNALQEAIRRSYISGWEQGMKDAMDMFNITKEQLEKKNG